MAYVINPTITPGIRITNPLGFHPFSLMSLSSGPKAWENTNIQREAWINNVTTRRICLKCRFGSTLKNREPKKSTWWVFHQPNVKNMRPSTWIMKPKDRDENSNIFEERHHPEMLGVSPKKCSGT